MLPTNKRTNTRTNMYTGNKSIRKQNRLLANITEMYCLSNMATLYRNSEVMGRVGSNRKKTNAEFRYDVIRVWYAQYIVHNGSSSSLNYKRKNPTHLASMESLLASPRKGWDKFCLPCWHIFHTCFKLLPMF